jgi:uncharacterized protein YabN with tetrapyrrole methylase and pyrophosphatase domain
VAESELATALARLDEITRLLRRECPWDREQDERSIVPHTVEEAYELADAAESGDDAKLLDELGDVLFQVYFLALLLEERGAGSLAEVAEHCREKLIRRHPHVFGRTEAAGSERGAPSDLWAADSAGDVVRNWSQIKRDDERGGEVFGEIAATLPSTLYAKKVLKRAQSAGLERDASGDDHGARLLRAVRDAVEAGTDPELELRRAADRYREQVERTDR